MSIKSQFIRVRGGGIVVLGGTKHQLHWVASIRPRDLAAFLKNRVCREIEDAAWRLNSGSIVEDTYLVTSLPANKTQVAHPFFEVCDPGRGWIKAKEFLMENPHFEASELEADNDSA